MPEGVLNAKGIITFIIICGVLALIAGTGAIPAITALGSGLFGSAVRGLGKHARRLHDRDAGRRPQGVTHALDALGTDIEQMARESNSLESRIDKHTNTIIAGIASGAYKIRDNNGHIISLDGRQPLPASE